jgi:KDO2-lipid IV(A) lauroyltransferase
MADRPFSKTLRYAAEAAGVWLCYGFFRVLPLDWASDFGGFLARSIGPALGISKRARVNLRRAMPELNDSEIERVVRGMWDNLGRVAAETPHLGSFKMYQPGGRFAVAGVHEALDGRKPETRFIFFSAHFGNWELAPVAATQAGLAVLGIYRAANNPFIDRIIARVRGAAGGELAPKGSASARRAIAALAEGKHVCMLVDQKMNDGIAVPFFGRDAMTTPALARLALRYDCVVLPCRVERVKGATFRLIVEDSIPLPRTGDVQADIKTLMTAVNATVERWVRSRPEQWFWLHRRWPD